MCSTLLFLPPLQLQVSSNIHYLETIRGARWQNKCHPHLKVRARINYIYNATCCITTRCSLCPQCCGNLKLHTGPLKLCVFIETQINHNWPAFRQYRERSLVWTRGEIGNTSSLASEFSILFVRMLSDVPLFQWRALHKGSWPKRYDHKNHDVEFEIHFL